MEYKYEGNTNDCSVTYHRTRTGPNFFLVYYKNAAQIRFTPKEVGRVFGVAKFTPWVNGMRDWAKQMVEKYESQSSLKDDTDSTVKQYAKDKGFGPEAHEEEEENPCTNTKMVI